MTYINDLSESTGKILFSRRNIKSKLNHEKPSLSVEMLKNRFSLTIRFSAAGINKFDLKNMEKNEIIKFLEGNNKDVTKAELFSEYSYEEIETLWRIASDKNKELVAIHIS